MAELLGAAFALAMLVAVAWDVATFEIPDAVSVALCLAALAGLALGGAGLGAILAHGGAAVLVFLVGAGLFAAGLWGGGDVKLLAATSLWLGFDGLLPYLLAASLAGGVLAAAVLLFRRLPLPSGWLARPWVARLHRRDQGLPYGVALGAGGLLCLDRAVASVLGLPPVP